MTEFTPNQNNLPLQRHVVENKLKHLKTWHRLSDIQREWVIQRMQKPMASGEEIRIELEKRMNRKVSSTELFNVTINPEVSYASMQIAGAVAASHSAAITNGMVEIALYAKKNADRIKASELLYRALGIVGGIKDKSQNFVPDLEQQTEVKQLTDAEIEQRLGKERMEKIRKRPEQNGV